MQSWREREGEREGGREGEREREREESVCGQINTKLSTRYLLAYRSGGALLARMISFAFPSRSDLSVER